MGTVRSIRFDAVIGVGGIGTEAKSQGISGKLNWIGIGPHKRWRPDRRGPLLCFDHFLLFDEAGLDFRQLAPNLAKRIYSKNVRLAVTFSNVEEREVERILKLALTAPPSANKPTSGIRICCQECCKAK